MVFVWAVKIREKSELEKLLLSRGMFFCFLKTFCPGISI
jgi:hypothetical protein